MRERTVERYLVKKCRNVGILCIKLIPDYMAGLPDRMVLHKGRAIFVELKAPGQVSRPIQKHVQRLLINSGFAVYELDSQERVDEFLRSIL
jgi:hypothetical protein